MTEWLLVLVIYIGSAGTSEHMYLPTQHTCESLGRKLEKQWTDKARAIHWTCTEVPIR